MLGHLVWIIICVKARICMISLCFIIWFIFELCPLFSLGTMYIRRNKSKSNKNVTASSSSSVSDCVVNLGDDNEKI
jgi:uncharacterized SAM-binding protein YcdF (DUF218 family)